MKELGGFFRELDEVYATGQSETVERFLMERTRETCPISLRIAAGNELGSFYRGSSRYEQSVAAFHSTAELIVREMGEESLEYATVLNNLAGTFRLMSRYEDALSLFRQAGEIYRKNGAAHSYLYASVLNNMALVHRETGELAQAAQYLEGALELICAMPDRVQETAITYNNLAALYLASGEEERAEWAIRMAMDTFARCAREENVHYAAGLNSLAGLLYQKGEYHRALELYEQSAEYTRYFFGENLEYAATWKNMAVVSKRMGDCVQAAHHLRRGLEVYRRFLPEDSQELCALMRELNRLEEQG